MKVSQSDPATNGPRSTSRGDVSERSEIGNAMPSMLPCLASWSAPQVARDDVAVEIDSMVRYLFLVKFVTNTY